MDERDDDEGPCPTCGKPVDPDTGVCQACLDAAEPDPEPEEPDPEQLERVLAVERLLAAPHERDERFCPGCLGSFAPSAAACTPCGGTRLVPFEDLRKVLEAELEGPGRDWWTPVIDDAAPAFFDALLEALDEEAPGDARVVQRQVQFDPVFGRCVSYRRLLYVRRCRLGLLRQVLARPALAASHRDEVEDAVKRWSEGHNWTWFALS